MDKTIFKKIRLFHDLSQVEFGSLIGVSQQTVSDIERGASAISPKTKVKVMRSFDFTPELLESLNELDLFDDKVV